MTGRRPEDELFSAAYEGDLESAEQDKFDQQLSEDSALRADYEAFVAMLSEADKAYAHVKAPDLMPGIRAKLKKRRGLLSGDRLGQLRGRGRIQPLLLALVVATVFLLLWLVFSMLSVVDEVNGLKEPPPGAQKTLSADSDR